MNSEKDQPFGLHNLETDIFDAQGNINSRILYYRMFGKIAHVRFVYSKTESLNTVEKNLKKLLGESSVTVLYSFVAVQKNSAIKGLPFLKESEQEMIIQAGKDILIHGVGNHYALLYPCGENVRMLNRISSCVEENRRRLKVGKNRRLGLISFQYGAFEMDYFTVQPFAININKQYNNGFDVVHRTICSFINEPDKAGIILLHGINGSGKTTYIRHLIHHSDRNFIFIPSSILSSISEPDFVPFIKRYRNSVLILEDCESILRSRKSGNHSAALLNLLNLSDGLLGDALHLKIICTFNTSLSNVDEALLRQGRLVLSYYFDRLQTDKSVSLQKEIHREPLVHGPLTLAEIYHSTSLCIPDDKMQRQKIGFHETAHVKFII